MVGMVAGTLRELGAVLGIGVGVEGTFALPYCGCSVSGAGRLREEGRSPKLDGDPDTLGDFGEAAAVFVLRVVNGDAMPVRTRRRSDGARATAVSMTGVEAATKDDPSRLINDGVKAALGVEIASGVEIAFVTDELLATWDVVVCRGSATSLCAMTISFANSAAFRASSVFIASS